MKKKNLQYLLHNVINFTKKYLLKDSFIFLFKIKMDFSKSLGAGVMNAKNNTSQRRRINLDNEMNHEKKTNDYIKSVHREKLVKKNIDKYFNKIVNSVIKAIYQDRKSIIFSYNYNDFLNRCIFYDEQSEGKIKKTINLGHPHSFLNEIMYEMCYDGSKFVTYDCHDNPMTLKSLFGYKFDWQIIDKNRMKISW